MDNHDKSSSKAFRKPRRMTITIPHAIYLELERRSLEQGRSFSNLSAYLLERAISEQAAPEPSRVLAPSFVSRDGHLSR